MKAINLSESNQQLLLLILTGLVLLLVVSSLWSHLREHGLIGSLGPIALLLVVAFVVGIAAGVITSEQLDLWGRMLTDLWNRLDGWSRSNRYLGVLVMVLPPLILLSWR